MNYTKLNETLARASKELMQTEPFYGLFLIMLNRVWTDEIIVQVDSNTTLRVPVGTASVSKNRINYQLSINPEFWATLLGEHPKGLLKHELMHIALAHPTDWEHLADKKVANIAMDLEINQYINKDWLPSGGMTLDLFPDLKLKEKAGTQYYYDELMKANKGGHAGLQAMLAAMGEGAMQVTIGNGGKKVNLPQHDGWKQFDDLTDTEKKLMKAQVDHLIQEAATQVEKSRGTIPAEIAVILERIRDIEPPKFDWKSYLRRFAGGSTRIYTKKLKRKFNKRFEEQPGLKIKPRRHVLVAVDTSGSVSDSELREFFNEIHHMHKTGTEITVVQCDAAISHIEKYNDKLEIQIHGRGGTSFQPVIDYYNENRRKFTSLIYLTDGEAPPPTKPLGKILWVISSRASETDELPGPTIKLN